MSINPKYTYDAEGKLESVTLSAEQWSAIQRAVPRLSRFSLSDEELKNLVAQLDERDARRARGEDVSEMFASEKGDDYEVPVEVQLEMLRRVEYGKQHPASYIPLEEVMKRLRARR